LGLAFSKAQVKHPFIFFLFLQDGLDFMPRYLINSHILRSGTDPRICAEGAAKMLAKGKTKDIAATSCYCGTDQKRVAFIIKGPDQHTMLETVKQQLEIPVASIFEVEEVALKK
jgi:hypothetical protein